MHGSHVTHPWLRRANCVRFLMEGVARRILEPEYLNRGNVRYWPKADIVYEEVTDKLSLSGFLTSAYLAFEAENGCRPSTVSSTLRRDSLRAQTCRERIPDRL